MKIYALVIAALFAAVPALAAVDGASGASGVGAAGAHAAVSKCPLARSCPYYSKASLCVGLPSCMPCHLLCCHAICASVCSPARLAVMAANARASLAGPAAGACRGRLSVGVPACLALGRPHSQGRPANTALVRDPTIRRRVLRCHRIASRHPIPRWPDSFDPMQCPSNAMPIQCQVAKARKDAGVPNTGHGCPLEGKKCPYFEKHKQDHSLLDVVVSQGHECPLAHTKCPFYKDIKEDKASIAEIDWEHSKCPLAGKCPYYEELKANGSKAFDCPVLHKCPHFAKKDGAHQVHHDYDAGKAAAECPYLKAEQAKAKAHAVPAAGDVSKDEL
ncbi:hypothetical protein BC831DRAFT_451850 [Entophlyctis helioformis]|nr:hypothetical protein BC831DRAFT_451850 [Entophlyctis helioformis]